MRVIGKAPIRLAVLLGFATLASSAHALTTISIDKCLARQIGIVGKGTAAHAVCYAKAARTVQSVDGYCLAKAAARIVPAFTKIEGKRVCLVEGSGYDHAANAGTFAASVDTTVGHAPGKCDSDKTLLVGRFVAKLASCYAKAAAKTGSIDGTCVTKASVKFTAGIAKAELRPECSNTGQNTALTNAVETFVHTEACALDPDNPECGPHATPTATPTPTRTTTPTPTVTATPNCGDAINAVGEPCDASAPSAGWGACSPDLTCTDCSCACPTTMTFSTDADPATTVLDAGWNGLMHRMPFVSQSRLTMQLDCPAAQHPCGDCTITGPMANAEAGAGQLDSQRCSTDASKKCTSDATCSARTCLGGANHGAACSIDSGCPGGTCPTAGTCVFYAAPPLALSGGGVAICVLNRVEGEITGTANVDTSEMAMATALTAHVYLGGSVDGPCPRCTDAGGLNDGVEGGTCDGGARAGLACDANGAVPNRPDFGRTSLDCPPAPAALVGALAIDLQNASDPVIQTLTPASPSCPGSVGSKCLCETCNNAAAEPCSSNADCPPSGGNPGICGGKRCLGGANVGTPCSASSECPSSTCARPGEPARPFSCVGDDEAPPPQVLCTDPDADGEGACVLGPVDQTCTVASGHAQRGCSSDMDCGGAPGSCESVPRGCFLTGGGSFQSSPTPGTDTLIAVGMEDPPLAGVAHPTLASVFCLGPTTSAAVNNVIGLPGPARVTIEGALAAHP